MSPTTGLNVTEKRKISCSYKESNHDVSICSPLTTFTMLSQIQCKPTYEWTNMCDNANCPVHTHTHTHTEKRCLITPPMTPCVVLLLNTGLTTPLYDGLELPWRALAVATLGRSSRNIEVSRGCPQGGVLSPFL